MSALPVLSGRQLVKALGKLGYAVDRRRGSHIILRHSQPPFRRAGRSRSTEIAKGTLRTLLRDAGLSVDDLQRML